MRKRNFLVTTARTAMAVLTVTAGTMLTACTDNEIYTDGPTAAQKATAPDNAIAFGTYMGKAATRAYGNTYYTGGQITNADYTEATGSHSLKDAQFGVFGYYTGTSTFATWKAAGTGDVYKESANFMYNQRITWDDTEGHWTYAPVKYWPNGKDEANGGEYPSNTATEENADQKLSFFAYAPYTAHLTTTTNATNKPESGDVGGVVTKVVTDAVDADQTTGIVAMSKNTEKADVQLKYVLDNAREDVAVDMLWGLRGQEDYSQTSGVVNNETALGSAYNTDLTKQIVNEKVKFLFKHALARVGGSTKSATTASGEQSCGLKVVVDVDANSANPLTGADKQSVNFAGNFDNAKTLVTIKEVMIRDKYTYDQEQGTSAGWTSDFLNWGWFDIVTGEWTKTGLTLTAGSHGSVYSVKADNAGTDYALNADIKEVSVKNDTGVDWNPSASSGVDGYTGGAKGVTTTPQNVYADGQEVPGLLLIPGAGNNTLYVTVDYFVRTADANLSKGYTEVEQVITNKVVLSGDILNPNKFYTLVMHLGLTSVKFEARVADWSNNNGNYDENGKEINPGEENAKSVWLPSNVVKETKEATGVTAAASSVNVTVTGLEGTSLTFVAADGTVVEDNASSINPTAISSGESTVTINYNANTTTSNRSGWVEVTDGLKTVRITLDQPADALTATKNSDFDSNVDAAGLSTPKAVITALKDAGGTDIPLSSATYSADVDWVHFGTDAEITVDANGSGSNRTATITIKVDDATATVYITQDAASSPSRRR